MTRAEANKIRDRIFGGAGAKWPRGVDVLHRDIGTWDELVELGNRATPYPDAADNPECPAFGRSSRNNSNGDWSGTNSWEEAYELAMNGWPKGRQKVDALRAKILCAPHETGTVAEPDVMGAEVDVDLFLQGEPECMIEYSEQDVRKRVYRLAVNLAAPSSVSAKRLEMRGAAVAALVDVLEAAGISVELVTYFGVKCSRGSWKYVAHSAVAKRAGDPLDIDRLSFALVSPAAMRRMSFAVVELEPVAIATRIGRWYGTAAYSLKAVGMIRETLEADGVIDPCAMKEGYDTPEWWKHAPWAIFDTIEGAREWMIKTARGIGLEVGFEGIIEKM